MPTLYFYLGLEVFFYSNDHLPIHVHASHEGRVSKAVLLLEEGVLVGVEIQDVPGRAPLKAAERKLLRELVEARQADIVRKWTHFFALNGRITPERITTRLRPRKPGTGEPGPDAS
jgi:hypothetical protein